MEKSHQILSYQRRTWKDYKQIVGLPDPYTYLFGNPVKVHVPIDTATNGVMIIGAYPTAHFNVIGSHRDVPVSDHLYPFSNEIYFDGSIVNAVRSGKEIEDYFLKNLGVLRSQCWITDLVKVFLFKDGHKRKYQALGFDNHSETRSHFKALAQKSKPFIDEEIQIANPEIILGLGAEVNSIMLNCTEKEVIEIMFEGKCAEYLTGGNKYCYYPVAHPGILMRNTQGSEKWREALNRTIKNIKSAGARESDLLELNKNEN